MPEVTVAIPTFRRPAPLARCLSSVLDQAGVARSAIEIIVIDNCPQASAKPTIDEARRSSDIPIIYVIEPRPGISHARNTAMATASARFIAFIDDDELAETDWLAELLGAQRRLSADMVFGPVLAEVRARNCADAEFFTAFYSICLERVTGPTKDSLYCGNVLLDNGFCQRAGLSFEPSLGLVGGEDLLFFRQAARKGARFAWCREARVHEIVPAYRATWKHVWLRSFLRGQTRTRAYVMLRPPDLSMLAIYVVGGVGQFALNGLAAAVLWPVAPRRARRAASRALKGLGKLFWMRPFRVDFYGASGWA
jgi:glycosyltransferase involved in cell wall biosynthesis